METQKNKSLSAKSKAFIISLLSGSLVFGYWALLSQLQSEDALAVDDENEQEESINDDTESENIVHANDDFEDEDEDEEDDDDDMQSKVISAPTQPKVETQAQPKAEPAPESGANVTEPQSAPASGPYKDGQYSASSTTPWGDVKITVTVKNGDWTAIQYNTIPGTTPSKKAANTLISQALNAQSAAISGVSGATYFSNSFKDDLKQIVQQSKK